jgi:hypothetical protein
MSVRVVHVHVVSKIWRVELDGHQPRTVQSAEVALNFARGLAREAQRGEVRIHYEDGRLESEYFGEDPLDPAAHARSHEALRTQLDVDRHRGRKLGTGKDQPHDRSGS